MMDQWESYILAKAYQTFYVHDGSTESMYIIEIEAKSKKTYYLHGGLTEIVCIPKNEEKYSVSIMD